LQELLGHATISITLDTYSLPPKAEAGQELGEGEVFVGGQSVGRSALVAQEGYEEASLWDKAWYSVRRGRRSKLCGFKGL
jgi:hypothetical protein